MHVPSRGAVARSVRAIGHRFLANSLLRNSVYLMAAAMANSGIGAIFWIVAAHTHSTHDVGLAAALIAAVTLAAILASTGCTSVLLQVLPGRANGHDWSVAVNAAFAVTLVAGLATAILAIAILQASSSQFAILRQDGAYDLTFAVGVLLWALSMVQDAIFIAERAAGKLLVKTLVNGTAKNLLLVGLLPAAGLGALGLFGAPMAANVCALYIGVGLTIRLSRRYHFVTRGIVASARAMARAVVGHHLINLGGMAPVYLLPALVTIRLSASDNAYYYTTWMVGGIFFMISPAVASALFAEGSHTTQNLRERTATSIKIIGGLLAPIMVIVLIGAGRILDVFGPTYGHHGETLLALLVVAAIPDAVTNIYVSILRVRTRLRQAAALNIGMALLSLVLAWLLLPSMGITGAGMAWLISQVAGSAMVGIWILQDQGSIAWVWACFGHRPVPPTD